MRRYTGAAPAGAILADENDPMSRAAVRRGMAFASMLLVILITMCFLAAIFNNGMADRVAKVWPAFVTIFPALIAQIMHYISVGSSETKEGMRVGINP